MRPVTASMSARSAPPWVTTSAAAWSVAIVEGDALGAGHDPLRELLLALAADRGAAVLQPGGPRLGVLLLALLPGEALEDAEAALAQIGVGEAQRDAQGLRDDLRRLAGAGQIARHRDVHPAGPQRLGERAGLAAAGVVERDVGVTLPATLGVPVGLAVAGQVEDARRGRHGVGD